MQIEYTDRTLAVATEGPLTMACWWDAPTVAQMRAVQEISRRREKTLAGPTAYTQFVLEGTPLFGSEVRAIAEKLTADHYALGIAHCIELTGLQGAATRAFLGGLLLIRRGSKPMKVFADPSEACD